MVHGGTGTVYRTRTGTTIVAAITAALCLIGYLATRASDFAIFSAPALLFLLQSGQRIEAGPERLRRAGLRAVELDLESAFVAQTGRSWVVELCFLGRSLELRDAHGARLRLESWLWTRATRDAICALVPASTPAAWAPAPYAPEPDGGAVHS
jgi:hypothetical protein